MSAKRWAMIALTLVALVAAVAVVTLPSCIRAQVQARASKQGVSVQVESVRPRILGVELQGVVLSIPDVPAVRARVETVAVSMDGAINVQDGQLIVEGERQAVFEQLARWRSRYGGSSTETKSSGARRQVAAHGMRVEWTGVEGPGSSLQLQGVRSDDVLAGQAVRFDKGEYKTSTLGVSVTGASVEWAFKLRQFRVLHADGIEADVRWATAVVEKQEAPTAASAVPVRDRLSSLAKGIWQHMAPGSAVDVGAFRVRLTRGNDQITIGPGRLSAQEKDGRLLVDLAPGAHEGRAGLLFRSSVPFGAGEVLLDVNGGPLSLALLGVREGDLGLKDVERAQLEVNAHVTFGADGKTVGFDGTAKAKDLTVYHPKLAQEPVVGLVLAAKLRGEAMLDGSWVRLADGEFDVGAVRFQVHGQVQRVGERHAIDVQFGIPLVGCQAFLDALPPKLIPVVHGMTAAGTLSLRGKLRFDPRSLKDFDMQYEAANDCRFTSVPDQVNVNRFRRAFRRMVPGPSGKPMEIESGPGTPGWMPLNGISRFMEVAVMITEDGRFRRHQGFDHEAIRNSVRENLRSGRFVRGASTISMQLAKNLYLSRDKTVSRKLQELILTAYLEQALTKDQIMELYLNAIEFGPNCYGVACASWQYFRTAPSTLSLSQSLYLSSILPNPAVQHLGPGGRVSEAWMRYLYKLMRIGGKLHWVTPEELEIGLSEWPVYGQAEPERVAPVEDGAQQEPLLEGDEERGRVAD